MKSVITSFVMLHFMFLGSAQINSTPQKAVQLNTSGLLIQSPLLKITVSQNANASLDFNFAEDLTQGKEIAFFYKIEINSDVPWVVTANSSSDFFTTLYMQGNLNNTNNIPTSVVSLKNNADNIYFPLGIAEKRILMGNATTSSIFYIDMKVNPSWGFCGGTYNTNINFNIAAQ